MRKRCCGNCVYATRPQGRWHRVMMGRFPALRVCFNSVDRPGRMQEVRVDGLCGNYRTRQWPHGMRDRPPKPPNDEVRYIPLTHGLYAIVDAEDYEALTQYKWHAVFEKRGDIFYAARTDCRSDGSGRRKRRVLMHREIMKPPKGMVIDHINGNGVNNRRCNMRICTQAQNVQNRRCCPHGRSRFIGVSPRGDKWRAAVKHNGKQFCVGTFDDEVEAAKARDRKALELFGRFTRLNFPEDGGVCP